MIVWGGDQQGSPLDTGGAYQIDLSPDVDQDGYTLCAGDCDDANSQVHPGAVERCNGRDDDCNGQIDEGFAVGTACVGDVDSCHQLVGALSCKVDRTGTECTGVVTLHDTTPPGIAVVTSPSVLWPPNHRMVDVAASVAASDACGTPVVSLVSIASTEPDNSPGTGDGNTVDDIQGQLPGSADFAFALRAERDGEGGGRTYQVTYSAVDGSGNRSSATSLVFVPHDEAGVTEPLLLSVEDGPAGTSLRWDPVPGALSYRVARGRVGSLRETGDFIDLGTVSCVQPPSSATSTQGHEDAENPPAGEAFFYVAAYNDGWDSGYGTVSAAKPEVVTGGGCESL
jgi:hypothetical protein